MLRRAALAFAVLAGLVVAVPAAAADPDSVPRGALRHAVQDTFAHQLTVRGWADDPGRPHDSIVVTVRVDGRVAGEARADRRSPRLNASQGFAGRHNFALHLTWSRRAHVVTVSTSGVQPTAPRTDVGRLRVEHVQPPPGERIVSITKQFVGKVRYVEGGASPRTGFDCSGYTKYAFAHARVAVLPHNSESQRHARHMRQISVHHARPGDLVFYMSGSYAYHVAIYAGHGMQYAAATPRDGIRYQHVWSRAVQYRTDWH